MKSIYITFVVFLSTVTVIAQNVGVGTTTPVAPLEIRGFYNNPAIPGGSSTGIVRFSAEPGDGIDIGKLLVSPFSGWLQAGFNGTSDPISMQPLGGNVGIGTVNPSNTLSVLGTAGFSGNVGVGTFSPSNTFSVVGNADFSGNVGIGIIGPEISAALEVNSTSKGFLPPRLSSNNRNNIIDPVAGLMIWCTDCGVSGEVQVHNGGTWTNMVGGAAAVAIGDNYGGGKVAYIFQPGDPGYIPGEVHGLIAAPMDQSNGSMWGCPGTSIQGAHGTALGTGLQNTIAIVNNCPEAGTAASKCYDLVLGQYDDWYLPSKDELNKLHLNREAIGGFEDDRYWSSSEFDSVDGWEQFIFSGFQCNGHKTLTDHVRAVRSF